MLWFFEHHAALVMDGQRACMYGWVGRQRTDVMQLYCNRIQERCKELAFSILVPCIVDARQIRCQTTKQPAFSDFLLVVDGTGTAHLVRYTAVWRYRL